MAHVVNFWPKPFLYAFGNTPPVCLTDSIPPEAAADVLLLGCGDPRNVLYTLTASISKDGQSSHPYLDFTCCDIEPAIIARNILLLTLLADNPDNSKLDLIWNAFYHIYIDQESNDLLCRQAALLLDLLDSLEKWHSSKYGCWIRLATDATLAMVRDLFSQYTSTQSMSPARRSRYEDKYRKGIKETTEFQKDKSAVLLSYTSMSPILPKGGLADTLDKISKRYWESGTTSASQTTQIPNPTLAFSGRGEEFILHYASCPILSFHMPAIAESVLHEASPKPDFIIEQCKLQFREWSNSLSRALVLNSGISQTKRRLTVRFAIADLFSLCGTLAGGKASSGRYTNPWNAQELVLCQEDYGERSLLAAPRTFNVIDTSNLVDHVAFLNLLTTTGPLLRNTVESVLLTETLGHVNTPFNNFLREILCGDPYLMGLLLNLLPTGLFSGFTSRSNPGATLSKVVGTTAGNPVFERTQWKRIGSAFGGLIHDRLSMPPASMAQFLYNVYTKMFEEETARFYQEAVAGRTQVGLTHYIRESFARFLAYIRPRLQSDWDETMDELLALISDDKQLMVGAANLQELFCYLGITGVVDLRQMLGTNPQLADRFGPPQILSQIESGAWSKTDYPNIASVTVRVPRSSLRPLLEGKLAEMGSPALQMTLEGPAGASAFHSIQPVFGEVKLAGENGERLQIIPDKAGVFGSSDLIVTCMVTTDILRVDPENTNVRFGIHPSIGSLKYFGRRGLSGDLALFKIPLSNTDSVFITQLPPNITSLEIPTAAANKETTASSPSVFFVLNSDHLSIAQVGVKFSGFLPPHDQELKDGAQVDCVTEGSSAYLQFGGFKGAIPFPLPVIQSKVKTRVARKSQYIEVLAPPDYSNPIRGNQLQLRRIPSDASPSFVTPFHRVDLDKLPRATDISDLPSWLQSHLTSAFSARELELQKASASGVPTSDLMTNMKDSLAHCFFNFAKYWSESPKGFILIGTKGEKGVDTLIFITGLCLDVSSHTVALDACVLPLHVDMISDLTSPVRALVMDNSNNLRAMSTAPGEQEALKNVWVAAAERCRTSWTHSKNCGYIKSNGNPISNAVGTNPFCKCAIGRSSPDFDKNPNLDPRLRKLVTRVAISPIFAVPYLEKSSIDDIAASFKSGTLGQDIGSVTAPSSARIAPSGDSLDRCRACMKVSETLKKCTGCKKVAYCHAGCQKADWKRHKVECKKAQNE
ncbi:hypothetical protein BJ508DRAFT_375376 [Ascobolus immersus RN42]|uniref:MYND-type domain-containing protein n=1 Tax=Ascobolus immersus RN42 TaxID=1160509 RepID=A0A3N4IMN7_ASCIM|nr:hypothetical protein BJ508DRAFT_375376 [Ascobolus immersus RN42]